MNCFIRNEMAMLHTHRLQRGNIMQIAKEAKHYNKKLATRKYTVYSYMSAINSSVNGTALLFY